jgi:acetyl-CoA C-acetyltransferase
MTDIVIVNGARTAMGGFQGALSSATAPELGAITIKEAIARSGLQPTDEEVIMGCVLSGTKTRTCTSNA